MLKVSCLCGEVRVAVEKRPGYLHECNCALCRKSGARWGYFQPLDVAVEGRTSGYSRHDKNEPAALLHFCPQCGSTTHFTLTEQAAAKYGNVVVGVNLRLADEGDLAGVELRFPDGATWPGEGTVPYLAEPRIL